MAPAVRARERRIDGRCIPAVRRGDGIAVIVEQIDLAVGIVIARADDLLEVGRADVGHDEADGAPVLVIDALRDRHDGVARRARCVDIADGAALRLCKIEEPCAVAARGALPPRPRNLHAVHIDDGEELVVRVVPRRLQKRELLLFLRALEEVGVVGQHADDLVLRADGALDMAREHARELRIARADLLLVVADDGPAHECHERQHGHEQRDADDECIFFMNGDSHPYRSHPFRLRT